MSISSLNDNPSQPALSEQEPQPRRRFSLQTLIAKGEDAIRRFPAAFVCLILLCVWLLILIWTDGVSQNLTFAANYSLCAGLLVSLAVPVWCRYAGRKHLSAVLLTVAGVLIAADFVYLCFNASPLSLAAGVAHGSVITALVIAIIFLPDRRDPASSGLYTYLISRNILATALIAFALSVIGLLIYGTLNLLFSVTQIRILQTMYVAGTLFIPAVIFIGIIPDTRNLAGEEGSHILPAFVRGLILYLLLPIAIIYMAILYVYGIQILARMTLPVGNVVYPVTGFTAVCLLLLLFIRLTGRSRLTTATTRILPWAMLPLLVLMSVAICYRIAQYGLTPSRLYVVAFNLWAYAAMIYLIYTHGKRFSAIPISFALIFLAVSIIPGANFTALANAGIRNNIRKIFVQAGAESFPLDSARVAELKGRIEPQTWEALSADILYLDRHSDHSDIEAIISFPVYMNGKSYVINPLFRRQYHAYKSLSFGDGLPTPVPAGYSSVSNIDVTRYNLKTTGGMASIDIGIDSLTAEVPLGAIIANQKSSGISNLRIPLRGIGTDSAIIIPRWIHCQYDSLDYEASATVNTLKFRGFLFRK